MKKILVVLLVSLMFAGKMSAAYDTKCFYDSTGLLAGAVHSCLNDTSSNSSRYTNMSRAVNSTYYAYYRDCAPTFNQIDTFVTATSTEPSAEYISSLNLMPASTTPIINPYINSLINAIPTTLSANDSNTTASTSSSGITIVYSTPVYNDGPVNMTTKSSTQTASNNIATTLAPPSTAMTKEQIMEKIQEIIQLIDKLKIELEKITNQKLTEK